MSEENLIIDEAPRGNFTQLPNIVDDMDLSVHAFRLYFHIKRRAGETGECWETTRNLAKACGMGLGTVTRAKRELSALGLIEIRKIERGHGEFTYDNIIIKDIWAVNHWFYIPERVEWRKNFWKDRLVTHMVAFLIKQVNSGKRLVEAVDLLIEAHKNGRIG